MENNKYILYKAQNEQTGEIYIGATTNSLCQRKLDHCERANRGEEGKFYNAISTYGEGAFKWEQVDTASNMDELAQKEKEYILNYNSKDGGYNSDSGGGFKKTVYQYDLETGELIETYDCLENAANVINATKQDISRACLCVNQIYAGFYWSYEYQEPFSPKPDKRRRKVHQYSLEGHLLSEYVSVSEASIQTGISKTCISRVCRGEREHSGGFKWNYKQ